MKIKFLLFQIVFFLYAGTLSVFAQDDGPDPPPPVDEEEPATPINTLIYVLFLAAIIFGWYVSKRKSQQSINS